MNLFTLLILAVGLSMDAFAVAVCKGLAMRKISFRIMLTIGLWFGIFQGIMPMTGYLLGIQFEKYINVIAPWCAFVLLSLIGINMIREAFSKEEKPETATLHVREMFLLAVATSIDALAVGITFVCEPVCIIPAASALENTVLGSCIITAATLVISMCGVKIGNVFGVKYKSRAEIAGGIILILIGAKILLEYFGVL